MLDVLKVSGPIYLLIIIGYGATHFNLFSKADLRVLGKFVINFALPALIFNALAKRAFSEVFDPIYFFAYLGGSLLVILLGFVLLPKTSKQHSNNPINRAIYALGMSCSNSGFVGYPILLLAIPAVAENTLALNLIVENCAVIPLILILADYAQNQHKNTRQQIQHALLSLIKNPLILGLVLGMFFSISGAHLPEPVAHTISMLAAASGGISLFVIGGTLVRLPIKGLAIQSLPIVLTKLIIHPLCVYLLIVVLPHIFSVAPLSASMRNAAILYAAMPMMGVYPIFGQRYNQENIASASLLMATVLSVISVNFIIWLLLK